MIVGDGFVIASPTKTGARSLAHLARTQPELGLRYMPDGHRMTVPAELAHYSRHMVVRNPYKRLASIYNFLRRRVGDWGHDEAARMDWPEWVGYFLDLRTVFRPETYDAKAPSIWLATQAECWRILRGYKFWNLESIELLMDALGIRETLPLVNATKAPAREVPRSLRARVWEEWARDDCEMFGYGRV